MDFILEQLSELDGITYRRMMGEYIIYYKEKKLDSPRFGITQAKKFGKAYKRNRYRRILREIIRTNIKVFKNEYDYIIIIMKKCDTLDFKQIEDNLLKVIKEKL